MFLLWKKARYILRHEGFPSLLKRILLFIRQSIFFSRRYYLRAGKLAEISREYILPDVEDLSVQIVTNNREYEELSAAGFVFKPWNPQCRIRLDKGAIAVCAFSGKQLVHVNWSAMTREAMKSFREPPYKVDFDNNEVASGDIWTHPEYRGKGIAYYVLRMMHKYMLCVRTVLSQSRARHRSITRYP